MLPISICCLVFGFCTIRYKQTVLNTAARAYCWAVTSFYIILCSVSFVFKLLRNAEFDLTESLYLFIDVVRALVISYYRLKFLIGRNLVSDILESINNVDKCLASVGIEVPHTRNLIACTLYTLTNISFHSALWYFLLVKTDILKTYNVVNEFLSIYTTVVYFITYYLVFLFVMHFVFIVHIIENLSLIHI